MGMFRGKIFPFHCYSFAGLTFKSELLRITDAGVYLYLRGSQWTFICSAKNAKANVLKPTDEVLASLVHTVTKTIDFFTV